tara:strand:+ start:3598 stop:4329 length:732 start_codon:yes stop_codon:yes gene_type:complete
MDDRRQFEEEKKISISNLVQDEELKELSDRFFLKSFNRKYPYHFTWMGLPIIQYPQDIVMMQEIIWSVKPSVIVETGIARGGSIVFYASLLKMLGGDRSVVGVDIDIRAHNRNSIDEHPMRDLITLIEGSSIAEETVSAVTDRIAGHNPVMVVLDSNHTHDHVLAELRTYAEMVSLGSYIVVFDTHCEFLPDSVLADRPWGKGNSPYTAVEQFLAEDKRFVADPVEEKLLLTCTPRGILRRVD